MVGPCAGAWLGAWRYAQAGAGAGPVRHAGHANLGAVLGTAVVARVNTENWKMLKTWIMFRRTLVLMTTQTGILSMSGMVTVGSLVLNMGRLVLNMT